MSQGRREGEGRAIVFATTVAASIEAFVNPVAASMASSGHPVHLIAGDRCPKAPYPHSSAVLPMSRSISPLLDLQSLRMWVSHLTNLQPRAVVIGTPKASLLGLVGARLAGVKVRVYVMHGAVWDGRPSRRTAASKAAERLTIRASTHQLAVSDSLARLVRAKGLGRSDPDVVGWGSFCGVDVHRFLPLHTDEHANPNMCFVGRLNRDKGIDVLLRTLDRVRRTIPATLTVVGGIDATAPPDAGTVRLLEEHPHVNWVGEVHDVVPYLNEASLLLFPTSREGLPQTVLEAQACGVPVVSWRVTGVIDAMRDGFTGLLVPFGDESALAAAATHLLTDIDERRQFGSQATSFVTECFEQRSVVQRNVDYLNERIAAV